MYLSSMISIPHTSHEGPIVRWRLGAQCAPRAPGDAPCGAAAAAQPNGSGGTAGGRRQETSLGRQGALWNFHVISLWDFHGTSMGFHGSMGFL